MNQQVLLARAAAHEAIAAMLRAKVAVESTYPIGTKVLYADELKGVVEHYVADAPSYLGIRVTQVLNESAGRIYPVGKITTFKIDNLDLDPSEHYVTDHH